MVCKETMRSKIIETAKKRFVHYGYAKTTMAEIAADLNMSPGNLYRYFPGKIDIAEALADETLEAAFEKLREVASREGLTSREKLRSFLQLELTWTYHQLDNDPRIFEIAQFIKKERPHHVNRQLAGERKILSALLAEGVRSGEFQIADVEFSAEMIQSATMKFRYPQLWSVLPLDKLTRELDGVFSLIVDGLTPRAAQAPAAAKSADPLTSLPQMVSVTY
ncbi:MAG: TetR family transcriptional regulator [Alphaproteobacteria bacterium]|nr:TetR family transcriptional regulator [Alphaproteobacteria bacterium]